jgi:type VI secretion system secreted protein Hcp
MAAVAYFLKLDGILGESKDAKHAGEIELESFSFGETLSLAGGGGGGGAGKVQFRDLHVVARTSKASPLLFLNCASGQHLKTGVLTARKAGKTPLEFLIITLTDVVVTAYEEGGDTITGPTDQVSLNFGRIQIEYHPQKPDGSSDVPVKAGWDVKKNQKI